VPIDAYGCTAPQSCNLLPGSPAAFDKANPTCEPDGHVRAVLAENAPDRRQSTSAGSVAQGRAPALQAARHSRLRGCAL